MGFNAYLITQEDNKVGSGFVDMDDSQLDSGEVTIAVTHSSINYKDALAATGAGQDHSSVPLHRGHRSGRECSCQLIPRFKAG
jgi:acrylyl-CoA reductase (NADPH)